MREGFYWVRSTRVGSDHSPEVAEWSEYDSEWKLSGSEMGGREQDFEVLSERLAPPERLFEVGLQCSNHLAGCLERCPNCVTPGMLAPLSDDYTESGTCAELGCSASFHKAYCPKFKSRR